MVDPTIFRDVMSQWPSGVTVVTTLAADGRWHGMTASSFSSVSLDPPLVSICLTKTLYTHELIQASGVFGVNVLAKDQIDVGRRFAGMDKDVEDRFAGETWTTDATGVPLLDSALGWFDCRLVHAYEGGDHTIFVGEVIGGHAARRSAPLLFHSRGWGQFADVLPDVATLSDHGVVSGLTAAGRTDDIPGVVSGVAAAGSRVRIADLTSVDSLAAAEMMMSLPLPLGAASVLVKDRAQAEFVLAQGVGTVEIDLDPADPCRTEEVMTVLDGIASQVAVRLSDPFDPERIDDVLDAVQRLSAQGVLEIGVPDSAGRATPLRVRSFLQEAVALGRPAPLRMGLHDRDHLGLVKAIIALKSGVRHFDTTLAGIDGAVATEDLIRLLEEVDVQTPVDPGALVALAQRVSGEAGPTAQRTRKPTVLVEPGTPQIVGATG